MPESLWTVRDAALQWLAHGAWSLNWWQVILFTLLLTHITMISVTIYLHRHQAHRSLDLHPLPAHFFRFWLWLTTGQVTKEWASIHRKHHAKCETVDDPHSPQIYGIRKVLLEGAELYRAESKVKETMERYGHGTPDDWIERNLYTRYSWQGVGLMMIVNLYLFGALGLSVWAVQMMWTPIMAAGIINGAGHFWGYRNFEAPDSSTNISPWGILIAGEELHNNHHTYPTSAKFSVKPFEFDIGWVYIRGMEMVGLAKARKTVPHLKLGEIKPQADAKTLEAIIANRYEVMAKYATELRAACATELEQVKQQGAAARLADLQLAKRWLHRDAEKIPSAVLPQLANAVNGSPKLAKLVSMREELRQLWTRTNVSAEQLVVDLQQWCKQAESSGIDALAQFSMKLRAAHA